MTKLSKPVRRKVETAVERRGLVITLYPGGAIGLRPARCRTEHVVPISRVYRLACEITAEATRKAREQRKAAVRKEMGLAPRLTLVRRGLLRP